MKKLFALLLICGMLAACACTGTGSGWDPFAMLSQAPTSAPTEAYTEAPTETPAEAPAQTPSGEPTDEPAPTREPAEPAAADNPLMPRLGRLCDGPIFPEPAKYLVVSGESDIFYVYNNMGELISTFHAVEDEYAWGYAGFFGEEGICENVRISTGEKLEPFSLFQDMILFTSWYTDEHDWGDLLVRLCDEDFEEVFTRESTGLPLRLGSAGGVLHIDGKYLVLDRGVDYSNWTEGADNVIYNSDPVLLDENGAFLRNVDPAPFERIFGVFGDKYIMGGSIKPGEYGYYLDEFKINIYDLDGQLIMEDVYPEVCSVFAIDDESYLGALYAAEYLEDSAGNFYDKDLIPVSELPEGARDNPTRMRYGNLEFDDYVYHGWGSVYVGVKDAEGNWLFRIYNPHLATDHDPENWDASITGDYDD